MQFSLSMVVLTAALAGFSAGAAAEERSLSPLQAQLQKMQSGEQYGMKTIVVPPAAPAKPQEGLNANAKALAEKAAAESRKPTRLEMIEEAYKKAAPLADAAQPAAVKGKDAETGAKKETPGDSQVMFEALHTDKPKIPPRLIPVE